MIKDLNCDDKLLYLVTCDSYANVDNALDIWKKFSNYFKSEELLLLNCLKDKDLINISQDELNEFYRIKNQLDFSNLLLKYKNKSCTKEEHDFVSKFMDSSLKKFVESRITIEQQESARKFITELFDNQELEQYIELQQKRYDSLNIYEAYILFIAKEKVYEKNQNELNSKIINEQKEKSEKVKKNIIKDYGFKY